MNAHYASARPFATAACPATARGMVAKDTRRCDRIRLMPFPIQRMRRLRSTESMRALVRETRLAPSQFILPLFVCPGEGVRREISSMPGNYQLSIDELVRECAEVQSLGIGGVSLFVLPETKDETASGGYDDHGI